MDDDDEKDLVRSTSKPTEPMKLPSPHYKANNAGGHGNPPVKGQFPKGNPGGPGRPRGQNSFEAKLRKRLNKKLNANQDGKAVKLSPVEIFIERLIEAICAPNASPRMLQLGREVLEEFGPKPPLPKNQTADFTVLSRDERLLLKVFFDRVLKKSDPRHEASSSTDNVAGVYRAFQRDDGLWAFERFAIKCDCPENLIR